MALTETQKIISGILGSSAFTVLVTKLIEGIFEERKAKRLAAQEAAKSAKDPLDEPTTISASITPICWDLLVNYVPEGMVNICEFHNGDRFFSRRSILRMTMTWEVCKDRGHSRRHDIQSIILSGEQLDWIDEFRRNQKPVYYPDTTRLPEGHVRDYYKYYRIRSIYTIGLYDVEGRLIGLLNLSSREPDFLGDQPLTGIFNQVQRLQNLLSPSPK